MVLLEEPRDRWDPRLASASTAMDELISRARLLAKDPAVLNPGGGNFSVKTELVDTAGRKKPVLWITGWGADAATLRLEDLACLRMDDLLPLRDVKEMTESDMIMHLLNAAARGEQPRPAIETLTHAFIPWPHVDHTHPEAIIALTAIPDCRQLAAETFGEEALWLDYRQFKPDLACELGARILDSPKARFVLMANHGLLTWGRTSQECYRNTIEAAARAAEALNRARRDPVDLGGPSCERPDEGRADELLHVLLPRLRGALSTPSSRLVLRVDRSDLAQSFASSSRGPVLSMVGPACPDSLVKTRQRPLYIDFAPTRVRDEDVEAIVDDAVEQYVRWYSDYCECHAGVDMDLLADAVKPRVVLLPGIGVISAGETADFAALTESHFQQTMRVIIAADAAGGYSSLSEAQAYADEYWPLIRNKPQLQLSPGRLLGRVVAFAGRLDPAAGRAVRALRQFGAHAVAPAGLSPGAPPDRIGSDEPGPEAAEDVLRQCVASYGGIDVLVHFLESVGYARDLLRRAAPIFRSQDFGGSCVLIDRNGNAAFSELVGELSRENLSLDVGVNGIQVLPQPWNRRRAERETAIEDAVNEAVVFFAANGSGTWTGNLLWPVGDAPELQPATDPPS